MSREIKFRAWNKKGKCWITFGGVNYRYENGTLDIVDSDNLIYEQYTGLKDKNDKEIYEGDIVKWLDGLNEYIDFKVEWQDNRARFCLRNEYSVFDYEDLSDRKKPYIEVIGNIHENPELLGDEDEDEDDIPTNAEINDLTDIGYGGL